MLSVYLDGSLVNEPIDTGLISEHLYYSTELSAYILEVDGNLIFTGSEYNYIRGVFNDNVCGSIEINIVNEETQEIDFEGLINVADVIFEPDKQLAICEVQNNNITTRVENNKSIDCVLNVGRTKNDIEYTVTTQTDITIYDPTGVNTLQREGIRIYDAFTSIITFISDGEIGFESDYFNPLVSTNEQAFSVLMNGLELRTAAGFTPTISFKDLFNDMNALENLAISFEDGKIRIEDKDYFKQQTSTVTFDSVEGLSQQLATETLYANVSFGSAEINTDYTYLQDIRFAGMGVESYHLGGQCNTDTELALSTNAIVTDPNIIQDVIPGGIMGGNANDAYDDSVLILQCDSNNDVVLTPKPGSATDFFYNDRYTNRNVALRWLGQIPQSIFAFLGNGLNGCYINQLGSLYIPNYFVSFQPTQESPSPWNDPNGNYAVSTRYMMSIPIQEGDPNAILYGNQTTMGFYTAPSNGVYSFEVDLIIDGSNPGWFIQRMISDTDSGAGGGYFFNDEVYIGGGLYRQIGGATFYLNAGEYVGVRYGGASGIGRTIMDGSTFRCVDSESGITQTYVSSDVYQIENKATYPICIEDWKTIKLLPFQSILLTYKTGQTNGWLKDISRNIKTGESEIVLLGKQNG